MPWKESRILDQRLQFLSSYQKEEMSVADLCREFGISRPTGNRWINRYNETGPEGLVDRSRRPYSCFHATLEPVENARRICVHGNALLRNSRCATSSDSLTDTGRRERSKSSTHP